MVRMAVLGCGRIGQMHAQNILKHPETSLRGVFDIDDNSASAIAKKLSVKKITSVNEVFESDEIDAVLVASATSTHADYIEMAIRYGKPILCEKPIDLDLNRVNKLAEIVERSSVLIQIGFNRRFDPGHRSAKMALSNGEIGDLHQVIITSRDPEMPPFSYYKDAGGLMRDMTIHDFDLARFMLGSEPVEVFAVAGGLIDPEMMEDLDDHDSAMIIMKTEEGKQCLINNSRIAVYGYDQRVELLGTKGMIQSNNKKPTEILRFTKNSVEVGEPYQYFFLERYAESFMAEITAFVESLKENKPAAVSFNDGHKALILAEAAYLSLKQRRLVKIEEVI
ncbi:MAG: inositol 2-dehydrogenase [Pseudomonadota bacterium]|nr:inositol 2-dehydrogenase [Pseudomonadota bacterium]